MDTKYVVRYGAMRMLGHFESNNGDAHTRGTRVVVRTERGLEIGELLCPASERTGEWLTDDKGGQLLRAVTADDQRELARIREGEGTAFDTARRMIAERKLQMELVDVEHLFGGERVVLYYLAENRVDFRELVKALAGEFQTRVEMRQIGVRDEAKLLADYGDCGKPVCCNTHLSKMPPVSMKMAKLQKSTLDPSKISGRCGRLKCCLRYEYDTYEAYQRELPPVGARVITRRGTGQVLAHEVLARRLLVEFEDHRRIPVTVEEVMTVLTGGQR
jgi:cell fate regulator YaaT (PSP1 superfamily)